MSPLKSATGTFHLLSQQLGCRVIWSECLLNLIKPSKSYLLCPRFADGEIEASRKGLIYASSNREVTIE